MRRLIVAAAMGLTLGAGCASTTPQGVIDLNRLWDSTRNGCATVYAAEEARDVDQGIEAMNRLVDDGKNRKAGKEAETLKPRVEAVKSSAGEAKAAALREAEPAVQSAGEALDSARSAEAETYAASEYRQANSKLDQARRALDDPCGYIEAGRLAGEAGQIAARAGRTALAEKQRLEEEKRRAEEARRLEEERRRKAKPPTHTVEEGNSLWRIAGMEKIFSDPTYWPLIYDANQDKIFDPNLIYPGQTLAIPRGMSESEMQNRVKELGLRLSRSQTQGGAGE